MTYFRIVKIEIPIEINLKYDQIKLLSFQEVSYTNINQIQEV